MAKDSQAKAHRGTPRGLPFGECSARFQLLGPATESILELDGAGRTWRYASSRDVTSHVARTRAASCVASGLTCYSLSVGVTFKAFGTRLTAGVSDRFVRRGALPTSGGAPLSLGRAAARGCGSAEHCDRQAVVTQTLDDCSSRVLSIRAAERPLPSAPLGLAFSRCGAATCS
jgi:hypothetical protein